MKKNLANELKKLDIEMGKKIFSIAKKDKITTAPSPLQARIIDFLVLHQNEDINQKDLKNYLEVSKATVSSALQTMENNEIIKRVTSKEDARSKKIILMENSKKTHED
ncbi:MAG: MarR family transcriptional regulator, partial [Clostridia bacterium]